MKYETFSFSIDEYAGALTENSHNTFAYLARNGVITEEQYEDLTSRLVIVPVRNHKSFGQRILERFFTKDSTDNTFVFVLADIGDNAIKKQAVPKGKSKPKLEVVE